MRKGRTTQGDPHTDTYLADKHAQLQEQNAKESSDEEESDEEYAKRVKASNTEHKVFLAAKAAQEAEERRKAEEEAREAKQKMQQEEEDRENQRYWDLVKVYGGNERQAYKAWLRGESGW